MKDINGNKLSIGDKVRKVRGWSAIYPTGFERVVAGFSRDCTHMSLKGEPYKTRCEDWEKIEQEEEQQEKLEYDTPNGKHKWHDIIVAWAKGAEIQYMTAKGWMDWTHYGAPSFSGSNEYRIKPKENKALQAAQKQLEDAQRAVQAAQAAVKKAQEGS